MITSSVGVALLKWMRLLSGWSVSS
nr:TPA_asm: m68.5 uORF [Murid betaherpesvirus 1]DBA07801.1 TPA_asm: m68.5 uORF [Murid betaherpesvirus 1]